MFEALPFSLLILIFGLAAICVWLAGTQLANTTDILSTRWGLGEALGGLILLAIVTNLPEIAITASGAIKHDLDIAVGNILGGIAIQTVVLVIIDIFGVGKFAALTYTAASLTLVLEGLLVISILSLVIMGTQLPSSVTFLGVSPVELAILLLWIAGVWIIGRSRNSLPWHNQGHAMDGQKNPRGYAELQREQIARNANIGTQRIVFIFILCSIITLLCGVVLEVSGTLIAHRLGISGLLFGATVLAAVTALPEVSTGLASAKLGDFQLAISDILGGNAFLPVLFMMASVIAGKTILPNAHSSDLYLTGLGILLTAIYSIGLIFRSQRQLFHMGMDSLLVLVIFIAGMAGLIYIKA